MNLSIDYEQIDHIFEVAAFHERRQLFEFENYALLQATGAESVPMTRLWSPGERLASEDIEAFSGDRVVLKVVSPYIVHKSDVGGVKVVDKNPGKVRSGCRRMLDQVVEQYSAYLEGKPHHSPGPYRRLSGEALRRAVARDVAGILICEYLPPDSEAFGNELLISLRLTREFGMVITAGLGGTDTELFAESFRPGQAVVSASTELVSGQEFLSLFKGTIAYKKLGGLTRGGRRLVSDYQLLECFTSFIQVGRRYSPQNQDAPYIIEELEINPFAFSDYEMVPLDGMCRFALPREMAPARSLDRISNLLMPQSAAIMGVSSSKVNFGRSILRNMLQAGFPAEQIKAISPSAREIDGASCVPSLDRLEQVDLLVVAVAAEQVIDIIDQVIEGDLAQSVILIPGGLGETRDSKERAAEVLAKIRAAHARPGGGPVFLGGNCLGLISKPGKVDSFFVPESVTFKDRSASLSNTALICQSGAFAVAREMKLVTGAPVYNITVGNQMDLTIGDFVNFLARDDRIGVIGIYAEGFACMDGLHLCRGIRRAILAGKEVVVYKAGRTPEGKLATSGHTASVAGDYAVCVACLRQAGALVADTFDEFDGLMNLASALHDKKIRGNQAFGIGSAGYEAVGLADYLQAQDTNLALAPIGPQTVRTVQELLREYRLDGFVDVKNPLDLTPSANDQVHIKAIEAVAADPEVHGLVVSYDSMCPNTKDMPDPTILAGYTDTPDSFGNLLVNLNKELDKPIVVFNDVGWVHEPLNRKLERSGIPVFDTCGQAMATYSRYISYRLDLARLRAADNGKNGND